MVIQRDEANNLAQTGGEDYDFIYFAHFLEEIVNTWSLNHINIVPVILDLDWHDIVGLLDRLDDSSSIYATRTGSFTYFEAAVH